MAGSCNQESGSDSDAPPKKKPKRKSKKDPQRSNEYRLTEFGPMQINRIYHIAAMPFLRSPCLRATSSGAQFFEYSLVSNQGASGSARNPSPFVSEKSVKEGGELRRNSFQGSFYRSGRSDTPSSL